MDEKLEHNWYGVGTATNSILLSVIRHRGDGFKVVIIDDVDGAENFISSADTIIF
jgi:hypothetical protein